MPLKTQFDFNQFDFSAVGKYSVCGACVSVDAGLCVIRGSIGTLTVKADI